MSGSTGRATPGGGVGRFPIVCAGVALVLSGCAGGGTGPQTAPSSTAAASTDVPATSSAAPSSGEDVGTIGFDHIGAVRLDMTVQQVADRLGGDPQFFTFEPGCSFASFDAAADRGPLGPLLSVQIGKESTDARAQVLGFGDQLEGKAAPEGLPRTAEGIGMGSTVEEVRAAYPTGLDVAPKKGRAGFTELRLAGPDGTGIAFQANTDDVVEQISAGDIAAQDACS